jgi:hypothetical protein
VEPEKTMKKTFKNPLTFFLLLCIILIPAVVLAVDDTNIVKPIGDLIYCYIEKILRFLIELAALGTAVMIIVGGFFYITSAGDAAKVKRGTSSMTAAVVGLCIVACSFALMFFIGKSINPDFSWSYIEQCSYPGQINMQVKQLPAP